MTSESLFPVPRTCTNIQATKVASSAWWRGQAEVVYYEELQLDLLGTMGRVAAFLQIPVGQAELVRIYNRSDLELCIILRTSTYSYLLITRSDLLLAYTTSRT